MSESEFLPTSWTASDRCLREGLRIYAVGDVHGRADLLRELLLKITSDLKANPARSPIVVFLGDYIDRGPQSAAVIDCVLTVQRIIPTICLSGNHEIYALRFLRDPHSGPEWFELGGRETLASYGITVPWRLTGPIIQQLSAAFAAALPDAHLRFLTTLGLTVSFGNYLFVHAGIDLSIPVPEQSHLTLTMIRKPFLDDGRSSGRIIVHGHSPVTEPDLRENRINIDTGAYITGRLTCVVLQNASLRWLSASQDP